MIQSLHIENVAVIKSLDIEFTDGFIVLTGETGAGKSIMIDSLGLLYGQRADRDLIRTGETAAEVSAVFTDIGQQACAWLEEAGFSFEDGTVMISRTIKCDAASTARLNGRSITLSMLREISAMLFHIHGQNDNQLLLDKARHGQYLDSYAHHEETLSVYEKQYREVMRLRREMADVRREGMENVRLAEMLKFQIADIDAAKLKVGEEEELLALSRRLQGYERIHKGTSLVSKALEGGEKGLGAMYLCERAASALSGISDAVPSAAALSDRLCSVRYELEDIASAVADIAKEQGTEDPTALIDKTEARLNTITKLKRKYGATVEEILSFRAEAARRLDGMEHADERLEDLANELADAEKKARASAEALHAGRLAAAHTLTSRVTQTLSFLDMPKVRFSVGMETTQDLTPSGTDDVEFLISTNPGEPLMPMIKIASGGELSRIMLSLKSVLNAADGMNTVIFDEVDTGISGKTSRKVGMKLRQIAENAQVLCVTHSAQIASLAKTHWYIAKTETDGRMQTTIRPLDEAERVEEIARILGGIEVTEAQRRAAVEMIEEGRVL